MKNAGKTTFDVSFGGMPRRDNTESRSDESGACFTSSHTFPKVPRLRRRVIPRIPVARRDDAMRLRASSSQDSLPRAVALEAEEPTTLRRHRWAIVAVGLVLGVCTALFRFAHTRFP